MDFKRKETTDKKQQAKGHIEQRIVDMAELYPESSLTGLSHKLSKSVNISDKISAVGIKYAVKEKTKIIQDSTDHNNSDGMIIDQIYDNL